MESHKLSVNITLRYSISISDGHAHNTCAANHLGGIRSNPSDAYDKDI